MCLLCVCVTDLQSCMICVARRVTAVEWTERFSTRHELSGEWVITSYHGTIVVSACDSVICGKAGGQLAMLATTRRHWSHGYGTTRLEV